MGDDNWIMAYVHIAHDCEVGNHTVLANNATLAGHVERGRLGHDGRPHGRAPAHAHWRTRHDRALQAMSAKMCRPSWWWMATRWLCAVSTWKVCVAAAFSAERIAAIKQMHQLLYRQGLTLEAARSAIAALPQQTPEARRRHRDAAGAFSRAPARGIAR